MPVKEEGEDCLVLYKHEAIMTTTGFQIRVFIKERKIIKV